MRWQYWVILFSLLGMSLSSEAVEQDAIINSEAKISDLSTISVPISSFTIAKIHSIQLEVKIEHSYIGDLTVMLQTPTGERITLHQQEGGSKNNLELLVTSEDFLEGLKGQSAEGEWKVIVSDNAKYDEGKLTSIYMIVDGDLASSSDSDEVEEPGLPTDPTPPVVVSGSCEEKWAIITSRRPLEPKYLSLINRCGDSFKSELKRIISTNRDLGYTGARQVMFSSIDNVNGVVCSVYTSDCLETHGIPSSNVMNCEHTWPQSKGATGIAKSDLHHLYPVESRRNSVRSNYPFCEVESVTSGDSESALGYSREGTKCFEPPAYHKGNVARSMFYFAIRYGHTIDAEQAAYFRQWNESDPVDAAELARTGAIEEVQGNRNPLVDHPEFISLF